VACIAVLEQRFTKKIFRLR